MGCFPQFGQLKSIYMVKLLNTNGTEIYRKLAFQLKEEGVTEEQYIQMIDKKFVGWRESEDMKKRIELLLEILFHTFF